MSSAGAYTSIVNGPASVVRYTTSFRTMACSIPAIVYTADRFEM